MKVRGVSILLLVGFAMYSFYLANDRVQIQRNAQLAQVAEPDCVPNQANRKCPLPDATHQYRPGQPYQFQEVRNGAIVTITNLYEKQCDYRDEPKNITIHGYCVSPCKCKGTTYIDEKGTAHTFKEDDVSKTLSGSGKLLTIAPLVSAIPSTDKIKSTLSDLLSVGGAQASPAQQGTSPQGSDIAPAFDSSGPAASALRAPSDSNVTPPSSASAISPTAGAALPNPSGGGIAQGSGLNVSPSLSPSLSNVFSLAPGPVPGVSPTMPPFQQQITPSSYNPTPVQTRGFSPTPSYTPRRDTSLFSFIPDFSPNILFNNVIRVAQNTVQPIITRIVIGGSAPAPLSIPGSPSRRSAPVTVIIPSADSSATLVISAPTIKDIIANVREQETSATSRPPDAKVNVSRLSDAQILQTYLDLKSAPPSVTVLQPSASRGSESTLSNTSVLDAAFSQSKNPASFRTVSQQITLFAPSSFSEENSLAPRTGSAVERGHPVSIVDLWSAILSGSFTRVREVLATGRPEPQVSEESREGAAPPQRPQPVVEQPEPHRGEALVPAPPPQLPPLPTTLWSPNFQAPSASAGISFTTSPTPVPRIGRSAKTEEEASSTSIAEVSPPPTFLGKVGNAFGKVLAWFSSPFLGPRSTSMSAGHSGSATVRLLADPPKAVRGAKTTLYWTSTGIDACTIFAPDDSEIGRGVEGTTLTPTLTKPAVFTARCFAGSSLVVTAVTVGIQ